MFSCVEAETLDLSKWDTTSLMRCKGMFSEFIGDTLILDWGTINKGADLQKMFEYSNIDHLSLRGMNFDTTSTNLLFMGLKANVLDLTDARIPEPSKLETIKMWFNRADIDYIITNNRYFINEYKAITESAVKTPIIPTSLRDLPHNTKNKLHRRLE